MFEYITFVCLFLWITLIYRSRNNPNESSIFEHKNFETKKRFIRKQFAQEEEKEEPVALESTLSGSWETKLLGRNVPLLVVEEISRKCKGSRIGEEIRKIVEEKFIILDENLLFEQIRERPIPSLPFTIAIIGSNGIGKTTTIAKIAYRLSKVGLQVGIAACDTFRSGAIEQLRVHCKHLNISLFEQPYGRDPASVGFQASKHFKNLVDIVLLDTAGRMHTNTNLMKSLCRFMNIVNPNFVLFVGEATSGNDLVEQITQFQMTLIDANKTIDAICLTKTDIAGKQIGNVIGLPYLTQKPILYLGTGQQYQDLENPKASKILQLLLS